MKKFLRIGGISEEFLKLFTTKQSIHRRNSGRISQKTRDGVFVENLGGIHEAFLGKIS